MDWVKEINERLNLYAQVQAVAAKMKAERVAANQAGQPSRLKEQPPLVIEKS